MTEIMLIFLGIILLMILGIPIAFAFAIGGFILLVLFDIEPLWATMQGLQMVSSFSLLAFPLYILMGQVLSNSGIAKRIIDFANALLCRIRGGVGMAVIVSNAFFGAMSGSAMAALGGLGKGFLEIMEEQNYTKSYSISLLIASSVLSIMIPPSGNAILFGFLGRLSIARCFLTGLGPGLVLMFFLLVTHYVISPRFCPNITNPPKVSNSEHLRIIGKSFKENFLTLLIPVVVLGVIYGGIATPTESAAIGAAYALILGVLVYRTIKVNKIGGIFLDSSKLVGSVLILLFFFMVMSRVLVIEQVSEQLLALILQVTTNKFAIILLLALLLTFLGMIIDDGSLTIISSILFLPIAKSIGFDPYHFMAITVVFAAVGLITPPVAALLYLGGHIAGDLPLKEFITPTIMFLLFAFLPTALIVIFIPSVSTFLPYLFMG